MNKEQLKAMFKELEDTFNPTSSDTCCGNFWCHCWEDFKKKYMDKE